MQALQVKVVMATVGMLLLSTIPIILTYLYFPWPNSWAIFTYAIGAFAVLVIYGLIIREFVLDFAEDIAGGPQGRKLANQTINIVTNTIFGLVLFHHYVLRA